MPSAVGFVQQLSAQGSIVCCTIGPSASSVDALFVLVRDSDTDAQQAFKRNIATVLTTARAAGYPVECWYEGNSAEMTGIVFGHFNVCPIGPAIHNDFYSVTGSAIPPNAELVFETASTEVRVTPDMVRPHWVLVSALPDVIPVGRNLVRLEAGGFRSDSIAVDVSAGPASTVRTLYPGAPKDAPYTMAFVADPWITTETGQLVPDPLLANRPAFHDTVGYCVGNLLTITEDCLRQGGWDAAIRFVAVFDGTLAMTDTNSLVHEVPTSVQMQTQRYKVAPFLSSYGVVADVAFVLHGSTTHYRAFTWASIDNPAQGATAYTYDGVVRVHGHYTETPGSGALSIDMDRSYITPLHEWGHAMSDLNNGRLVDLYVDPVTGPTFVVNKKFRALSTDPVPPAFAAYNGTNEVSDLNRNGLGYLPGWTSYHPVLRDPIRPNVMDDYKHADQPLRCRFDLLTYGWMTDRLTVKLTR